ncbi:MAG: ketopantoate reductase family protein [Acidobacteria bacterium]|nr:ketopantoate reductase family protein [Candidatus Sulfomarinibacter sp. MAG AM1]
MKTLIYGAGPIGRWLALRLQQAGKDVTLFARNETYRSIEERGIEIVDGLTGERLAARPKLVDRLDPEDHYDLVVVAMQKSGRMAVCPLLAQNEHLKNILFLGNDVSGFQHYLDHLPEDRVLLGFPGLGGGWEGDDLVIMDREKTGGPLGEIFIGELDGAIRPRTVQIRNVFDAAGIGVSIEKDMDGWLKYHFAFMAPTAGVIFMKGGDLRAVASDKEAIHQYCRACREAGNVLREIGFRKRQPPVFNLYYWLPRWLEPVVFSKLFGSRSAEVRFGLHARTVGPELLELADEFTVLKSLAGMETPDLDTLLDCVSQQPAAGGMEVAS